MRKMSIRIYLSRIRHSRGWRDRLETWQQQNNLPIKSNTTTTWDCPRNTQTGQRFANTQTWKSNSTPWLYITTTTPKNTGTRNRDSEPLDDRLVTWQQHRTSTTWNAHSTWTLTAFIVTRLSRWICGHWIITHGQSGHWSTGHHVLPSSASNGWVGVGRWIPAYAPHQCSTWNI